MIESSLIGTQENDVDWDIVDFTVFGAMLAGVGAAYALLRRQANNSAYRLAAGIALAAAFILLWITGAVGIIGAEGNVANIMYIGVLAVGIIGATIARFRPTGMERAMYATALAQATIAGIAIIGGLGSTAPKWPADILILTAFFVSLWVLSGRLFRKAA